MTEEKVQGQVPEASGQGPQPDRQGESAVAQGQEPERYDAEYVKQLRREAAEYRRRLRELEQKVREREEADLSETERLQKRLAELEGQQATWEQERQARTLKYEVMILAQKLGVVDPEAAYRLVDLAEVEFDEDGVPTNLERVLRDLLAKRPYLAGGTGGSATNPARSATSPTVFTRSQLRDPKFFQAHREAIMQAMREGRIVEE